MKLILMRLFACLMLLLPVTAAGTAQAVNIFPICSNGVLANNEACKDVNSGKTNNPIVGIIKTIIIVISFITGVAATILIVISGLKFMTAGGDPGKVAGARSTLLYALIGVAVTILAQALVVFILNRVG